MLLKLLRTRRNRKAAALAAAIWYDQYLDDLYTKIADWHNAGLPPELA